MRNIYHAAIVDVRLRPDQEGYVVDVKKTRRLAREAITWHKDADHLRIRRCRIFLYES